MITPALPSSAWRTETLDGIAGARLLVHTDGLTDAAADGDEPFGEERLAAVVARHPAGGAALVDALLDEMRAFTGGRAQNDDVTLLAASLT